MKLLYEGVSFFDYSTVNLVRIEGYPVTCCSRLTNVLWLMSTIFAASIFCYILITQTAKFGKIKNQLDKININANQSFNASQKLRFLGQNQFYVKPLLLRLRNKDL